MIEYITGNLVDISPAEAIVEQRGVAYKIKITLNTFDAVKKSAAAKLFIHLHVKNEGQNVSGFDLYGFATREERAYFEAIISVSGIGTSTARLMLSSLKPNDIATAIALEDVERITSVKGIGPKTAKRAILELKDKIGAIDIATDGKQPAVSHNTMFNEALNALVLLGFNRNAAQKVLRQVMKEEDSLSVEALVKESLKKL